MKFIVLLVVLALAIGVFMGMEKHHKPHHKIQKYIHKAKACKCIKEGKKGCEKLKCCKVYKHVPYKVFTKFCKYGKCKNFHHPRHY